MITVSDVGNHIRNTTGLISTIDVITDNGLSFNGVERWMYRAEHDNVVSTVYATKAFDYPPDDHVSVVDLGGLFFACDIPHVLHYAASVKTQARPRHFFMCPQPDPVVVWNNYSEYSRGFIAQDTLVRSVRAGNSIGDEFIKAGHKGYPFRPDVLIFVRVS
eukprot:CAMPEP_0202857726 /NCGR_PEP_ID=MMETSP1391-20130828/553_1 /ASSEMBLY_ACC=CAM_ASM_000867 /TAXON_ID=1034604 /ORGANISM="Chlamydomonas leiostraca, Strain SAG 11-49" /LENGTH=160 /DNA_ID=CAMNT_0049536567 /DNA_START=219 /DNA_END=701 /DNA_ORIENTATION=+